MIEATLGIQITHQSGPEIADANHVRQWLCADGGWMGEAMNGFTFEVCPDCPDPDGCECQGTVAIYFASISYADWKD